MTAGGPLSTPRRLVAAPAALALAASFWLVAAPVARAGVATCNVVPSASTALIGDQITFTGSGFAASTAIEVYGQLDAGPLTLATTGTTDGSGGFVFMAPMPAVGLVTVTFVQTGGCSDSAAVTVSCVGNVTATTANSLVGDTVTFTGTSFASSTAISVFGSLDNGPQTLAATGTTDGSGGFVFTTTMPIAGLITVTFSQTNGCSDSTAVTVGAAAPTPVASGLPNASMSKPSAPSPALAVTLLVGLIAVVALAAVRSRRPAGR